MRISSLLRQICQSFRVVDVHVKQIPFIIPSVNLALCLLGLPHVHQEVWSAGLLCSLLGTQPYKSWKSKAEASTPRDQAFRSN